MLREVDESVILVAAGADDADDGLALGVGKSEIGAVAAATGNLLDIGRLAAFLLFIEF